MKRTLISLAVEALIREHVAAIRRRLLKTFDELNRPLLEQVWRLQDAAPRTAASEVLGAYRFKPVLNSKTIRVRLRDAGASGRLYVRLLQARP